MKQAVRAMARAPGRQGREETSGNRAILSPVEAQRRFSRLDDTEARINMAHHSTVFSNLQAAQIRAHHASPGSRNQTTPGTCGADAILQESQGASAWG